MIMFIGKIIESTYKTPMSTQRTNYIFLYQEQIEEIKEKTLWSKNRNQVYIKNSAND